MYVGDEELDTAEIVAQVACGAIEGVDLIVPVQTLRALAAHSPAWTGREGSVRVVGVSRAAVAWGGTWDLRRLAVYDGSSGRRVNTFDGAGLAVIEVRQRDPDVDVGPDDPTPPPPEDSRSPLPFLDIVRREGGWTQVILRPTPACDLHCPHCFVPPFDPPSADDLDRGLELAAATLGAARRATLVLSGGEPLLSPDLDRVISWARERSGLRISLQTHGALVTRKRNTIEAMKAAGLWDVLVNLPSFDPDTYRELTGGSGRLEDTLLGVDLLVDLGLEVNLNMVVTRANVSQVPDYMGQVHRRWGEGARVTLSTLSPNTPRDVLAAVGVPHEEARAVFDSAQAAARELGIELVVAGGDCAPPACLLPQDLVARESWFQCAPEEILILDDEPLREGARYKVPGCATCRFDDRCPGVASVHVAVFGVEGLSPVP